MQIESSKRDIIWNYIGVIVAMGSNFILLPFLIKNLNSDILGLWYVYLSIGGIVTLFDFGFNPTLARNIAYCWSGAKNLSSEGLAHSNTNEPNYYLLKNAIDTCKIIYFIISILALVALLTIGTVYIYHISKDIFNNTIITSWLIYIIAVFLNLYYGYFATFLRGVGAVAIYNKINIFSRFVQIIISIVLLSLGYSILSVAISYLLYGFLLRILSKKAFYKYQNIGRHLKDICTDTNFNSIKHFFSLIWHNAWRDGLVTVSNYCASQSSTLIASIFLTLKETGVYSISVQLITAIATIATCLYTAYQPAMQSAYINSDYLRAKRLMSLSMIMFFFIFLGGTVCLIMIGIPILKLVKPENTYDIEVIIGIAVYYFFYKRQSCYTSFISNTNFVPYVKAYILSSIAGILLSILLVRVMELGVWGLILGQFIPQLFYNIWKWPKEVYNLLSTTWFEFVLEGIVVLKNKFLRKINEFINS